MSYEGGYESYSSYYEGEGGESYYDEVGELENYNTEAPSLPLSPKQPVSQATCSLTTIPIVSEDSHYEQYKGDNNNGNGNNNLRSLPTIPTSTTPSTTRLGVKRLSHGGRARGRRVPSNNPAVRVRRGRRNVRSINRDRPHSAKMKPERGGRRGGRDSLSRSSSDTTYLPLSTSSPLSSPPPPPPERHKTATRIPSNEGGVLSRVPPRGGGGVRGGRRTVSSIPVSSSSNSTNGKVSGKEEGIVEARPICKDGSECTNTEPTHWIEFQHTAEVSWIKKESEQEIERKPQYSRSSTDSQLYMHSSASTSPRRSVNANNGRGGRGGGRSGRGRGRGRGRRRGRGRGHRLSSSGRKPAVSATRPTRPERRPPRGTGGGEGLRNTNSIQSPHHRQNKPNRGHRRARSDVPSQGYASSPSLQSSPVTAGRQSELERFVTIFNSTHFFVIALNNLEKDSDKLARAFVNISASQGQCLPVIRAITQVEFEEHSSKPEVILRGNCIASKMMKIYCRQLGQEFIYKSFGKFINDLVKSSTKLNLEIDPSKLVNEKNKDKNGKLLLEKSEHIVSTLTSREIIDIMPRDIRAIAGFIAEFAKEYAPSRLLPLVGGFVMLRLVNPSIATPEAFGVLDNGVVPSREARRNLVLITKLLQNLSNNVEFGGKEEYMMDMNVFIKNNRETFQKFLEEVVADPQTIGGEPWRDMKCPPIQAINKNTLNTEELVYVYELLIKHREKLEELVKEKRSRNTGSLMNQEDRLFLLLDELHHTDIKTIFHIEKEPLTIAKKKEKKEKKEKKNKEKKEKKSTKSPRAALGEDESKKKEKEKGQQKKVKCRNCGEPFTINLDKPLKKCPHCKFDGKDRKKKEKKKEKET